VVHSVGCGVAAPLAVTDRGMPRYIDAPIGSGLDEAAPEKIAHAVRLAETADVVVLVLGDRMPFAGETRSTATLELPGEQRALFQAVRATGTPLVVVLLTSKPLAIPDVAAHADAILLAHNPGMEGGTAIAEALLGDLNPSGKLTLSWPHHVGQQPVRYDQAPGAHQTGYPDLPNVTFDALFPFGFGLSYTTVRYFSLRLARTELASGDAVEAEVSVTNRGNLAVDELVQCYLGDRYTSVVWPAKKLKAWQRVTLAPGAVATVRFTIPFASLALCDADGGWVVEPGEFQLMVGGSSRDADLLRATFVVRDEA
jgi:beta-glucosidase